MSLNLRPHDTLGRLPARKKVVLGGQSVELYSIGWLAVMINRTPQSIRLWERRGWLPKPLVSLPNHPDRWYLGVEVQAYTDIFQQVRPSRHNGFGKTTFKNDCWRKRAELKANLATKNPAMFAPLPRTVELEQAALRAQMERKTSRKVRVMTQAQRKHRQQLLKTLNQSKGTPHES